jgi:uncharacterized protein (DUF302 family)
MYKPLNSSDRKRIPIARRRAWTPWFVAAATAAIFVALATDSNAEEGEAGRFAATDAVSKAVATNTTDLKKIVVIDHARLAEKEGVPMPPSTVTIYSDPKVDAAMMSLNPRVGLDLPQKILVFEEDGQVRVAYQQASFLAARHGITDKAALSLYEEASNRGLRGIEEELLAPVTGQGVARDLGITELVSEFEHATTIERLREAVLKQGDTVWFGDIDFKSVAAEEGVELPASTLLLFGGPKPGGVAMAKFPKLGLDAFCQKLLVYEDGEGKVRVIFNDIAAMAKLHYGKSSGPHDVINKRLAMTFEGAVRKAPK